MRRPMTSMNFLAANGAALSDMGLPSAGGVRGGRPPANDSVDTIVARGPVAHATGPPHGSIGCRLNCSPRNGAALPRPAGARFYRDALDRPTYSSPASNTTVAAWAAMKPDPSRFGDTQPLTKSSALPATQAALPAMTTRTPRRDRLLRVATHAMNAAIGSRLKPAYSSSRIGSSSSGASMFAASERSNPIATQVAASTRTTRRRNDERSIVAAIAVMSFSGD